jgi:hypothetical protein
MASTTITRPAAQLGTGTAVATLAGIIGIALALAVAAAMLFNTSPAAFIDEGYRDFGLRHPVTQSAPERYPDQGLRHPAVAPANLTRTEAGDGRLDDYGLRCIANGWCSQPASSNGHR